MPSEPGPFGWVANLSRWAKGDVRVGGSEGPLPPPRGYVTDPTDRDLYTGMIDGWMSSTVGASLSSFFSEPRSRKELYLLFERMDMTDMAGSVLDIYAEDATAVSPETGKSLWFTGNPDLVAALDAMAKRLDLDHELMPLARETGKFGDSFNRLVYQSGIDGGVRRMLATPPLSVARKEDKEARLLGYTQEGKKFKNGNSDTSHPWDFVHFRLRGRDRRYPYGTSLLHNGQRVWKEHLCVAKGTPIWTPEGVKNIEDIQVGDKVLSYDPVSKKTVEVTVTMSMKTGHKKVVKVKSMHRHILVTGDHPVLVKRNGEFMYVNAEDLRPTYVGKKRVQPKNPNAWFDSLVLPHVSGESDPVVHLRPETLCAKPLGAAHRPAGVMDVLKALPLSVNCKKAHAFLLGTSTVSYADYLVIREKLPVPEIELSYLNCKKTGKMPISQDGTVTVTEEMARFFGFMCGDGWLLTGAPAFALGVYENLNKIYIDIASRLFPGVKVGRFDSEIGSGRGGRFVIYSAAAGHLLKDLGYVTGAMDHTLPSWVMSAPRRTQMAFLSGLLDADGCPQDTGHRLGMANLGFMTSVRQLAQRCGLNVSSELKEFGYVGKVGGFKAPHLKHLAPPIQRHAAYRLYISGFDREATPVDYEFVTHVEPAGTADVYDITVDHPLHNFIADGVVVHNCLSDWALGYQIGKHPDRNLFLLDVGSSSEVEKQEVGRKFATKLKKNLLIDPGGVSGRNGNTQSNPWTALEDLVMMVSSDSKTRIEKISGSGNALDIAPIKMLEQRFFAACRCPQSFFNYGDPQAEPINPKASLTNQNIRYARTARRLQQTVKEGVRFMAEMNLMLLMSPGDRLTEAAKTLDLNVLDWRLPDNDFQVNMASISFLDELERLEVMQTRMQVALAMSELSNGNPVVDTYNYTAYLLREVCQIPEDRIDELLRQDIENQHIDNMGAGLLPDGTNPHAKTESRRRMTAEERREARKADGTLTHQQKTLLSEAIEKNPALREALYTGRRLWENKESSVSHSGILPNCELIRQGHLKDSLTEEDVQQMLEEARTETGIDCALED